jgi:predicted NBD/HSP70 family sugar kinase
MKISNIIQLSINGKRSIMIIELRGSNSKKYKDYKSVFNFIRSYKSVSKSRLEEMTGLKLTTLNRAVNWLLQREIICADESGESSGGRKPLLFSINPKAGYMIGIDISRLYTRIALLDMNCNVIRSNVFGMSEKSTPDVILQKIYDAVLNFCADIQKDKVLGIGIGVVGPIEREKGIIRNPENFPAKGWKDIPLKELLESKTGFKVIVESGANAAVFGEFCNGYGKEFNSMAYIISGVGLRLGIIANGKLVNNISGNEGELGHITVDIDGVPCSCGNRGCLEMYTSTNTILECFIDELKKGKTSLVAEKLEYNISTINLDNFCEAVRENDETAVAIVKNAAHYFSAGIANIINIAKPELVILGGAFIIKCDLFYHLSTEMALQKLQRYSSIRVKFSKGELEENAVLVGAANLMLDYFLGKS